MGAVDLGCACVVSFLSAAEKEGLSGIGGGTFIIASRTRALLMSSFLNRLSINSMFVFPEQRQAMVVGNGGGKAFGMMRDQLRLLSVCWLWDIESK